MEDLSKQFRDLESRLTSLPPKEAAEQIAKARDLCNTYAQRFSNHLSQLYSNQPIFIPTNASPVRVLKSLQKERDQVIYTFENDADKQKAYNIVSKLGSVREYENGFSIGTRLQLNVLKQSRIPYRTEKSDSDANT